MVACVHHNSQVNGFYLQLSALIIFINPQQSMVFTIHETEDSILKKVKLLFGSMPGHHVGQISWSLLYVAVSETRELNAINFFPGELSHKTIFSI